MTDKNVPVIPDLPLQLGESDQYVSGIVVLQRPAQLVEIIVKDLASGQEWKSGWVPVPAPVEAFWKALQQWRGTLMYPPRPKVPTWTLDSTELEAYCLRYRQAYELMGDGKALKAFRLQIFQNWKQHHVADGSFPSERGQKHRRKIVRENFNNALDAYLEDWRRSKTTDPYSSG